MEKTKKKHFSLIICNQVLEHVFNPHLAFKNMLHHLKKSGHIYISLPTLNSIHGEPYFYSSGFHPRFLERIAKENNLSIINIGYWGSKKYLAQAVMGHWLAERDLRPLPFSFKSFLNLSNPLLFFTDGRKCNNHNKKNRFFNKTPIITDCWGLFRKTNY